MRWIVILGMIATLLAVWRHFEAGAAREPAGEGSRAITIADEVADLGKETRRTHDALKSSAIDERPAVTAEQEQNSLPWQKVEDYLMQKGRSAGNLLGAFHALKDTNYLVEAAMLFPDDPRVQLSVLTQKLFPDERRKWLERFKASAPDNAMPNYLLAREYLETGDDEAGIQELIAAAEKAKLDDYSIEARVKEEELQMWAGKTALEARLSSSGWAESLLGSSASLKALGRDISRLQKQFAGAGQPQRSLQMLQAGFGLVERLASPEKPNFLQNQLVAWAIEWNILEGLDADRHYDFLSGGTPQDREAQIRAEKASLKRGSDAFNAAFPNMSETEKFSFSERQRAFGEIEALRWLQKQR